VRRALASLFVGAVGKDTVSRVWRKVKGDWDAWNARSLAIEPTRRVPPQGRSGAPAGRSVGLIHPSPAAHAADNFAAPAVVSQS
jgi:hypothetical protein